MGVSNIIEGFGFGNYRSFNKIQYLGPLRKINIIIGQNNSGKSNILRFLSEHYERSIHSIINQQPFNRTEIDIHQNRKRFEGICFSVGFTLEGEVYNKITQNEPPNRYYSPPQQPKGILSQIIENPVFSQDDSPIRWMHYNEKGTLAPSYIEELSQDQQIHFENWHNTWSHLYNMTGGDFKHDWIPGILKKFLNYITIPKFALIPCIRRVHQDGGIADHDGLLDGSFIINKLAEVQNPAFNEDSKRDRFIKINQFLQELTGDSSAHLEIPHNRNTINVFMNNRRLPLEHLGTGIQEVIIMASAATALENMVVCIEEPELHLHPDLQRKLISYLQENTDNQYFITTHSAHILDFPDVEIFHVKLVEGESIVSRVTDSLERFEICKDLGYKASDIIQTNSIIWVEGPSDRIYLNYWINQKAPELKEGLHYSIMFYGGRLLSHLSVSNNEVEEFIALHKLNQNMAIVIDSDKKHDSAPINQTKERIEQEFTARKSFVWITEGKEIENYIKPELLKSLILENYKEVELSDFSKFSACLQFKKDDRTMSADKVKIAKLVTLEDPDFDIYNLDSKIDALINFIHECN